VSDAGSGSGTLRLRRKIPLLFGQKSSKTVCFGSFILMCNESDKQTGKAAFSCSKLVWKKFRERIQPFGSIPFAISDQPERGPRAVIRSGML
jgi:hypothetical protein